uniref:DUF7514 domain-containing protein n=1 Tax=Coccidioides posadasii RMSCC 3488 TaxID=454284 RepID=A0A0J6FNU5_COCPO|nr:hypothetical protein CPAG_06925 [Coccidioides posadasii RMSCC 3488]
MAYEGYGSSQPYEQGAFNGSNSYANSQQFHNHILQASYHGNYEPTSDGTRVPIPPQHPPPNSQSPIPPPPITAPPATGIPEPFPDPSRFYQSNSQPTTEGTGPAFQPKLDISPEVIAQITSSVIQQLKGFNFGANIPRPPPNQTAQNPDITSFTPSVSEISHSSPTTTTKVYTPPSPFRQAQDGSGQSPQFSNLQFTQNIHGLSQGPVDQDRISRVFFDGHEHRPRPSRLTTQDETPAERIWGQLFDKEGLPTPRLGQFLRGIAAHLIEVFPPENTLVVTPDKMQKYYEDTKSLADPYPWKDIFDDGTSSISRLYREVQAEHHLIQDRLDQRPDIPGLTPRGFERWMRLMIVAHPEQEYQRLQRTVLEMPINNPDDPKKRFPKELPRRLFPKSPDHNVKEHLERSILTHCHVDVSKPVSRDQSQPNTQRHRVTPSVGTPPPRSDPRLSSPFEEEDEEDEEDDDEPPAPPPPAPPAVARPIERERKPYSVQPGAGRIYEDKLKRNLNSPVEQAKYREFGSRRGRRSPATGRKRESKDYRDTDFVKTPISARFRDESDIRVMGQPRGRSRKGERTHGHLHDREFDREGQSDNPSRGSWDTDEEDYYRASSALSGRGGRNTPLYDDDHWAFR